MSKYLIVEMLENASGLKELRLCSVRWHGCTILYRIISMQLDAKKACCRKRDPLHHPSSSDCRRWGRLWDTLCRAIPGVAHISSKYLGIFTALRKRDASSGSSCRARDHACKWTHVHSYSRFHQQDAGSHAFIAAKVSSTRRGQPRFPFSQSFINKTGAATLSFQPSLSTSTFKQIYIPSRRTRAFSTSSGISPLLAPTRSSRTELDRRPSWPSLWTTHAWAGTCILWRNNNESFLSSFQTIQKYVCLYLYRLFRPFTYTE